MLLHIEYSANSIYPLEAISIISWQQKICKLMKLSRNLKVRNCAYRKKDENLTSLLLEVNVIIYFKGGIIRAILQSVRYFNSNECI